MNKTPILFRSIFALTTLALLVGASQRPKASSESAASAGSITTLYANDPLEDSLDFLTGQPGMVVQDGEVRNRDSHMCMGYFPDSLTVAIQGGDTGAIVDLGTLQETASASSTTIVGNGGNAYVSIRPSWVREQAVLQQTTSTAHATIKSGHVYLARIVHGNQPDLFVKLLVLEFRPGESVTFRWQKLG